MNQSELYKQYKSEVQENYDLVTLIFRQLLKKKKQYHKPYPFELIKDLLEKFRHLSRLPYDVGPFGTTSTTDEMFEFDVWNDYLKEEGQVMYKYIAKYADCQNTDEFDDLMSTIEKNVGKKNLIGYYGGLEIISDKKYLLKRLCDHENNN